MACACESSAPVVPGTTGCCSISSDVPSGQPVRLEYHIASGGAPSGAEVPVYRSEDGSVLPLTIGETARLWIYWISAVTELAGDVNVYFGTVVSADSNLNTSIVRGYCSAAGGIVANMPLIRLSAGAKVWVKSAGLGQLDVVGYGVLA